MSKSAVPTYNSQDQALNLTLSALKQNVDELTGQSRNTPNLSPLPATASLADVIAQLNRIVARLE